MVSETPTMPKTLPIISWNGGIELIRCNLEEGEDFPRAHAVGLCEHDTSWIAVRRRRHALEQETGFGLLALRPAPLEDLVGVPPLGRRGDRVVELAGAVDHR